MYYELSEKWRESGKDTADMPAIVVRVHFGHDLTCITKQSDRERYGIDWKLSLDDPEDLHIRANYFPVHAVDKVRNGAKEFQYSDISHKFKSWVYNTPNFSAYGKNSNHDLYVPGFCLQYRNNWCWTTKKPFGPQKDLPFGYESSAIFVYPKPTLDPSHKDDDYFFGENWLEWYGKRHYLRTPEEVMKAQYELELDIHMLYIDGDDENKVDKP